ncbi:hypothetical protein K461DRAFT_283833 [Myriangium duriaei CBS 260.36]|uniref:Zn(2)-C6 fungal-type domain-containing protein n=1 Tax=Myriangium duriaei CBS 260.36 TaxID=1168546 RepID=A0A9P4MPA4_9PEZI|nr:hypothetical protein K461DRAFT_283833 [Myriangium duriaei CBS 260.36]
MSAPSQDRSSTPSTSLLEFTGNAAKSPRVLSCVSCQQRKVKCERKRPCTNCVKAGTQCVAAALAPRQRRRRFAERDLLDRIRQYEALLRRHSISFDPLHPSGPEKVTFTHNPKRHESRGHASAETNDEEHAGQADLGHEPPLSYRPKNFWTEYKEKNDRESVTSHTDLHSGVVNRSWDETHQDNDLLFFGSANTAIDLVALHPSQMSIFKLWQIYIENINPLLRILHTPTMQTRILDAATRLNDIKPAFEALMFAIYCVSISSLSDEDCRGNLGFLKHDILTSCRFACRQALQKSDVLRSDDFECLTALYLYIISVRPDTDPRSLSSILAIALRNAQRMGLDVESVNAGFSILEGEMRRRLWWSLVVFDTRICELVQNRASMLIPTWDCKLPLNINDFDIRPETKALPIPHERPTEAFFVVVRSQLYDQVRHSATHLDYTNPALKALLHKSSSDSTGEVDDFFAVEKMLENNYLRFCDEENPLHCMTAWTTRGFLAKCHLIKYYARHSKSSDPLTQEQRNAYISYAMKVLDYDTKLMTSPLTKGYRWLVYHYLPMPAYLYLVQELKSRPAGDHVSVAWEAMNQNYKARAMDIGSTTSFLKTFSKLVLQAWSSCEAALQQPDRTITLPELVLHLKEKENPGYQNEHWDPRVFGSVDYHNMLDQANVDPKTGQLDWNMLDWQMSTPR